MMLGCRSLISIECFKLHIGISTKHACNNIIRISAVTAGPTLHRILCDIAIKLEKSFHTRIKLNVLGSLP